MTQRMFGGRSSIPTTDLDANFSELYGFAKNLISDGAGNVGIGAAPSSVLTVTSSSVGMLLLQNLSTTAGGQFALMNNISTGLTGTVYSSAYVGGTVGGVGANGVALSANGNFAVGTSGTANLALITNNVQRISIDLTGNVRTGSDNAQTLGTSSYRWSVVYAGTGTINTSDAREKTPVTLLTDAEIAAAKQLASEIGSFRFLDAVVAKGQAARLHIGMTVQRAIEVMQSHGLDPFGYGFICHDTWAAETVPARYEQRATGLQDANGQPLMEQVLVEPAHVIPAGDRYGFRADELLLFLARGFDARLQALEARA